MLTIILYCFATHSHQNPGQEQTKCQGEIEGWWFCDICCNIKRFSVPKKLSWTGNTAFFRVFKCFIDLIEDLGTLWPWKGTWKALSKVIQTPGDDSVVVQGHCIGKSLSEALIFASSNPLRKFVMEEWQLDGGWQATPSFTKFLSNPQYDNRLFIELQVQQMKILRSNVGRTCCVTEIVSDIQNNFCKQHVLPMFCKKKSFRQRFTCTLVTEKFFAVSSENVPNH